MHWLKEHKMHQMSQDVTKEHKMHQMSQGTQDAPEAVSYTHLRAHET